MSEAEESVPVLRAAEAPAAQGWRMACVYGVTVLVSGIYQGLVNGGTKGLWFGLCMGALALVGAVLRRQPRTHFAGTLLVVFACAVVGGWFTWETFVKNGGRASLRIWLVLAATLATAGWLLAARGVKPRRS